MFPHWLVGSDHMLAYGRSRRFLRFSCDSEVNRRQGLGVIASDEVFESPPENLGLNYPPFRQTSLEETRTPPLKSSDRSIFSTAPLVVENEGDPLQRYGSEGVTTKMSAASEHSQQRRGNHSARAHGGRSVNSPELGRRASLARPRFRLEMDLGADSDSSEDEAARDGESVSRGHEESGSPVRASEPGTAGKEKGLHSEYRWTKMGQREYQRREPKGFGIDKAYHTRQDRATATPKPSVYRNREKGSVSHWEGGEEGDEGGRELEVSGSVRTGGQGLNWSKAPLVTPDHRDRRGERTSLLAPTPCITMKRLL